MRTVREGSLIWRPSREVVDQANMTRYMNWLKTGKGLEINSYHDLWEWSVTHLEDFWASMWDYNQIEASKPYMKVLSGRQMPGARWFEGSELNYAGHVFRHFTGDQPAILFQSEFQPLTKLSWGDLRNQVTSVATALAGMGVGRGDRVAAYLPNIPQTVVAFLACAGLGAIWSGCSPDFGSRSVIDRFRQIAPKVLFAVDGYQYGGKAFDRRFMVDELRQALPTLERVVKVPYLFGGDGLTTSKNVLAWEDLLVEGGRFTCRQVPFEHPLWVLYSSGTTGLPKPIVQSHGGILVEHLKYLGLHLDLKPGDRFFWFTTIGWVMWNILLGGLLNGATILLYDGSTAYPDPGVLWRFAGNTGMTHFGTGAAYLTGCLKSGLEPGKAYDLTHLRAIGSTGSPLPVEGFQWVYEAVKSDVWLTSASGGTDVSTGFLAGCPLLPVHAGELQCRALGVNVQAYDEKGRPLVDEVGELVVTDPMPSMPLYFWNDPGNQRYLDSYFDIYPGVWRHGDWIKITPRGSAIIYGRSDSTLNRMGVRMGSSEIYSVVEDLPEVKDSLIVGIELPGGGYYMPLFLVLAEGAALDDPLKAKVREKIRAALTPRHVPDEIFALPEVPRTLSGKKLEVPVKKILSGVSIERAVNIDSMSNPNAITYFAELANRLSLSEMA
ncbi:MAG: acetoacetate--CoA ligase [Peptococcaceae bacterium]|nr:acetoacetate--CoA ligase [Peptococcaceae bacterium]